MGFKSFNSLKGWTLLAFIGLCFGLAAWVRNFQHRPPWSTTRMRSWCWKLARRWEVPCLHWWRLIKYPKDSTLSDVSLLNHESLIHQRMSPFSYLLVDVGLCGFLIHPLTERDIPGGERNKVWTETWLFIAPASALDRFLWVFQMIDPS